MWNMLNINQHLIHVCILVGSDRIYFYKTSEQNSKQAFRFLIYFLNSIDAIYYENMTKIFTIVMKQVFATIIYRFVTHNLMRNVSKNIRILYFIFFATLMLSSKCHSVSYFYKPGAEYFLALFIYSTVIQITVMFPPLRFLQL